MERSDGAASGRRTVGAGSLEHEAIPLPAMRARLLLEIAIRVLGLWLVVTAITSCAGTASLYLSILWGPATSVSRQLVIAAFLPVVVQGVLGAILTWFGPWIASRFYSAGPEEMQVHLRLGPGDVYHVACFVLGVYLLVQAAEPACRLAANAIQGIPANSRLGQAIADLIVAAVYSGAGVFLIFGSRKIVDLISNLRYDPDTIPKQQISLAVLLSIVLLFAMLLGTIRWLMLGGP